MPADAPSPDVIDQVAGLAPGGELAGLRRRREDFVRYTQGSYDVLLHPADAGGISRAERAHIAAHIAQINDDAALASHYRGLPAAHPPAQTARLATLMAHVELVARTPRAASQADLAALQSLGLDARDIVVLSQLIAFVSYQVRVLAGLRLLQQEGWA